MLTWAIMWGMVRFRETDVEMSRQIGGLLPYAMLFDAGVMFIAAVGLSD